jgi:hypothetical protein
VRFRALAQYRATRVDIAGLRARVAAQWGGHRMFLDKLERDWAMFSFTTNPDALPSIASTASGANGGFDPRDVHVSVSRRGAMIIYNSDVKSAVGDIEAQLGPVMVPLSGSEPRAKEGTCVAVSHSRGPPPPPTPPTLHTRWKGTAMVTEMLGLRVCGG